MIHSTKWRNELGIPIPCFNYGDSTSSFQWGVDCKRCQDMFYNRTLNYPKLYDKPKQEPVKTTKDLRGAGLRPNTARKVAYSYLNEERKAKLMKLLTQSGDTLVRVTDGRDEWHTCVLETAIEELEWMGYEVEVITNHPQAISFWKKGKWRKKSALKELVRNVRFVNEVRNSKD